MHKQSKDQKPKISRSERFAKKIVVLYFIVVSSVVLSTLFVLGGMKFFRTFDLQKGAIVSFWIIVAFSSFFSCVLAFMLVRKFRKLGEGELKKYLALKRIHNQVENYKIRKNLRLTKWLLVLKNILNQAKIYITLKLFVKTRMSTKPIYKLERVKFIYLHVLTHFFSVINLIILLYTSSPSEGATPLFTVYLFLIINIILILIDFVQVWSFRAEKIQVGIQHFEILYDNFDAIYPYGSINPENIENDRDLIKNRYRDLINNDYRNSKSYQALSFKELSDMHNLAYSKSQVNLYDEKTIYWWEIYYSRWRFGYKDK